MTSYESTPRAIIAGTMLLSAMFGSAAYASKAGDAKIAITTAQAKIETGDRLGTTDQAADIQARARTALSDAQNLAKDHHNSKAYHSASYAAALADLAIATAELKTLTTQRDQLAAR